MGRELSAVVLLLAGCCLLAVLGGAMPALDHGDSPDAGLGESVPEALGGSTPNASDADVDSEALSGEQSGEGSGLPGEPSGLVGERDRSDPDLGDAFDQPSTEPRFAVAADRPAYWRTGAYDQYDGQGWSRGEGPTPETTRADGETLVQEVEFATEARRIPAATRPEGVDTPQSVERAEDGGLRATEPIQPGETVTVESSRPVTDPQRLRRAGKDYDPAIEQRYTEVPDSVPDRVTELSDEITAGEAAPYDQAMAIRNWLRANREYSLDEPPAEGEITDELLFEREAGHCAYFATAMTTMLRSQEIPARYAVGYGPGQRAEDGDYVVRDADAHAWVEVYFPEIGWVPFDPTPAADRDERIDDATEGEFEDVSFDPTPGAGQVGGGGDGSGSTAGDTGQSGDGQQEGGQQDGEQQDGGGGTQQDGGTDSQQTDRSGDQQTDGTTGQQTDGTTGQQTDGTGNQTASGDGSTDGSGNASTDGGGNTGEQSDDGSRTDGQGGDQQNSENATEAGETTGDLAVDASLLALPGRSATATVEDDDEPVAGATVVVDGEVVGTTDVDGTVEYEAPWTIAATVEGTHGDQTATTRQWILLPAGLGALFVLAVLAAGAAVLRRRGVALRTIPGRVLTAARAGLERAIAGTVALAGWLTTAGRELLAWLEARGWSIVSIARDLGRTVLAMPSILAGLLASIPAWFRDRGAADPSADGVGSAGGSSGVNEHRESGDASPDAPPTVLDAWETLVRRSGVRQPDTKTPGEIARQAKESGLPAAPVDRLTSAVREIAYADDGPQDRHREIASQALSALRDEE